MAIPKKNKRDLKESQTPSLSADVSLESTAEKIFDEVNKKELQKSLDRWLKDNQSRNAIAMRDLGLLKSIVAEYLDAFIVFGYTLEGERVILQNFQKARDRDAIMEFLKTIFIKQQQENFLD